MGTLKSYWQTQDEDGRKEFAGLIKSSVANIDFRYVGKAKHRQRPSNERMALMREASNGEITVEGLATEFVIEPVTEILKTRNVKAPASEG